MSWNFKKTSAKLKALIEVMTYLRDVYCPVSDRSSFGERREVEGNSSESAAVANHLQRLQ